MTEQQLPPRLSLPVGAPQRGRSQCSDVEELTAQRLGRVEEKLDRLLSALSAMPNVAHIPGVVEEL